MSYVLLFLLDTNFCHHRLHARFSLLLAQGKKLISDIGDMMSVQVVIEGSMNSSNPYFSSSWRRDFTVCASYIA